MAKSGRPAATNARAIENMNETQLAREISKTQNTIDREQNKINSIVGQSQAEDFAMRGAFPLGAGGMSTAQANKYVGKLSEQSAKRGRELSKAIDNRDSAQKRLNNLKNAQKKVKGTGKTLSQLQSESKPKPTGNMKWKTVQKSERTSTGFKPRIIRSGAYEIRGNSILNVFKDGVQIGRASSLSEAKAIAERN